jgi:type VI secretion system protein VasD
MLSGCSFWQNQVDPQLRLNIQAATNINPNVKGKPSPLELRIYQLSDNQAFNQAGFVQIFNDPQGVLKADLLVARQLASVFPGENREVVLPLAAEVRYVGVVAGFSDYREAKNKIIYILSKDHNTSINIDIDSVNISLSEGK